MGEVAATGVHEQETVARAMARGAHADAETGEPEQGGEGGAAAEILAGGLWFRQAGDGDDAGARLQYLEQA